MADRNQVAWDALQVMHAAVVMTQRPLEAAMRPLNITSTQRLISRARDARQMANTTRAEIDDLEHYIDNFSSPFTLNHHMQRRQVLMSDWNEYNTRALDAENEVHTTLAAVPEHLRRRLLEPMWPSLLQPIGIQQALQELADQRRQLMDMRRQLMDTLSQNNTPMTARGLRYRRRLRMDLSEAARIARSNL